jgi:hypothetical protein
MDKPEEKENMILFFTLVKNVLFCSRLGDAILGYETKWKPSSKSLHFVIEIFPLSVPHSSFPSFAIFCFFLSQPLLSHSFSYILFQDLTLSGAL